MKTERYLEFLKSHNGSTSVECFDYFCDSINVDGTNIRNNLEKDGLVEHRYGRINIVEKD